MTIDQRAGTQAIVVRRAPSLRMILIVSLLAFVGGAVLVTWGLTRWEPGRRFVAPTIVANTAPVPPVVAAAPVEDAPPTGATTVPETQAITESRVSGLEARLAQIDAQASLAAANAARAEGLLIAFAVRRTIDRGAALGYLEAQLRTRFGDTQPRAVAAVIAAAQGPVTLDLLRQRLDTIAPALAGGGRDESWWDATRRTLGGLVVVRRTDAPSPAPDERLARARMALTAGQADTALAEIARLPARTAATDWMTLARRYIEAHRALDILEASALTSASPMTSAPTRDGPTNTGKHS